MGRSRRAGLLSLVVVSIAVAGLAAVPAAGQALYGSIVGNVTDPQGSAVPGVVLTVTNTGTGLKLEVVVDAGGGYAFRNLPPGTYDLTATITGFREHKQTGVPVSAGNPSALM